MKSTSLPLTVALALAATLCLPQETFGAETAPMVAAPMARCDCGQEIGHSHSAAANAVTTDLTNADWTADLRARLAAGEEPSDLHSTLVDLVGRDATRAMEAVLAIARTPLERHALAAMTAEIWGAIHPSAAWQWARQESSGLDQPDRAPVYAAVLKGVASQQPELVAAFVDTVLAAREGAPTAWPVAELTQAAIAALVNSGEYATSGNLLTRWRASLPSDQLNPALFALLAKAWSEAAPLDAGAWLSTLPDSEHRKAGLSAAHESALREIARAAPPSPGED
jgi:hypothetical protein